MDLDEFLDTCESDLLELGLIAQLESEFADLPQLSFALIDDCGTIVQQSGNFPAEALAGRLPQVHTQAALQEVCFADAGGCRELGVPVIFGGRVQGCLACFLTGEADEIGIGPEALNRFVAKHIAGLVLLHCAMHDLKKENARLDTKTKHISNEMEVLREQHHEIQSVNIRQREQLEESNEALELQRKQLEDYGKNLELKVAERTAELQLAKEKAEESDRFKSQFLANMSHEMRTPLNSIIGFTEMVLEDDITPKQQEYLEKVGRSSFLLLNLVNDILDLSKLQANQMKIDKTPTNIVRLFDDIESNAKTLVAKKGSQAEIRRFFDERVEKNQLCDAKRLLQIMNNLISNASKFTETGFIEFGVRLVDEGMLLYSVQDTGIGIAPEKHDLVFQSFQQADGSTTRKYGGTGLGLTITKNLVELMGGTIRIESGIGKGTTFFFTMPNEPSAPEVSRGAERPVPQADDGRPLKKYTVLLVEDSVDNQMLAQAILKKQGYTILLANDGMEAVETYKTRHAEIAVVLMDMQMPRMGGLEATSIVRDFERDRGLPHKPVIALTAGAMEGDKEDCIKAGCDDYLTKPINKKLMLSAVKAYAEKNES